MHKIIVVEDHPDFREILSEEINDHPDLECIGTFGAAPGALDAMESGLSADIIVLDIGLPSMSGLEALPKFRTQAPDAKVMILTISENRSKVMEALSLGAHGYILKTDPMERILAGLINITRGEAPMSPAIAAMVLGAFRQVPSSESILTAREVEVLSDLADGQSRKEVAITRSISINTVHNHVRSIYEKLQVHNLSSAIKKASSGGLI
ncbi:MAG: response regulator transcription factor [Planctomycetes bacterium]|nr:response regulator transcription factor [Planctomycetota bacterium]